MGGTCLAARHTMRTTVLTRLGFRRTLEVKKNMKTNPPMHLRKKDIIEKIVDVVFLRGPMSRLGHWLEHKLFKVDVYELQGDEVVPYWRRMPRFKVQDVGTWQQVFICFGVPLIVIKFADGRTLELSDKHEDLLHILQRTGSRERVAVEGSLKRRAKVRLDVRTCAHNVGLRKVERRHYMKTTRKHLFPLRVLIPLALSGAWYAAFSQVTFAPAVNYTVGPPCSTACLAVADVNGDGKVGLVSANAGYLVNPDNTLSVLTNNGNGTFGYNATYTVGSGPHSVTAADVNGDGRVDLICANFNDNTLSVLTNDGNGGFGYRATYNVGALPSSVVAADVNGDGHLGSGLPELWRSFSAGQHPDRFDEQWERWLWLQRYLYCRLLCKFLSRRQMSTRMVMSI